MIEFKFTVKLLSGHIEAWSQHDSDIRNIAQKHGAKNLSLNYEGNLRHVSASYPELENLTKAGKEISLFFRNLGCEQTVVGADYFRAKSIADQALREIEEMGA